MATSASKRSNMILYADPNGISDHRIKIILAEKSVPVDIIDATPQTLPEELIRMNPYGSLPTLVDRDLTLYEPWIIAEYLDERFPHPPLLPVYPIARAKARLMMLRMEREWYPLVRLIRNGNEAEAQKARHLLQESLLSFAPVFASMPYFLAEDFSLLDCCLAPLLWHLPRLGIQLASLPNPQVKPILQYTERVFARPTFKSSLSQSEREHEDVV